MIKKIKYIFLFIVMVATLGVCGCDEEPPITIDEYTVTFETNGGNNIESIKVVGTLVLPTPPTKEGYTFDGWYEDQNLEKEYDSLKAVDKNLTLYAKWVEEGIYITFDYQNGAEANTVKTNEGIVTRPMDPENEGYTFTGWYEDKEGTKAFDFTEIISENTTIYACWEVTIKTFEVTFVTNGGNNMDSLIVTGPFKVPTTPEYTGFNFVGWYSDEALTAPYDFTSEVTDDVVLYAKWEEATIDTRYTDTLQLTENYQGKEFIADGIGEVTLLSVIDGDTITVRTGGRSSVTIRYLGVNTPESTGQIQAWGKAASKFMKDTLLNAYSVLLEAEGERVDSTGNRYLAWIWYKPTKNSEYRLVNLELVELAYSRYITKTTSKYHEIFQKASDKTKTTGKRVYGEIDLDFNYSNEAVNTTLAYMYKYYTDGQAGTKYTITVKVTRQIGKSFFVEDVDPTYIADTEEMLDRRGIYCYADLAPVDYYRTLAVGDTIIMTGKFEFGGQFGTQLTDLENVRVITKAQFNDPLDITTLNGNELINGGSDLAEYEGKVVTIKGVTFVEYYQSANDKENDFFVGTLTFKTPNNQEISVRIGKGLVGKWTIIGQYAEFIAGETYDITGGVSYYEYAPGKYQLVLGDKGKEQVEIAKQGIVIPDLATITESFDLPLLIDGSKAKITWTSSNEDLVKFESYTEGDKVTLYTKAVITPGSEDTVVTLTATIKYSSITVKQDFTVTIKGE